ncbi:hypothetical protein Nepgr_005402 [Nepenthes gracilis]|uniref:FYVE-type domain-containing protein n=1 Tax=Nepenthes gracilis TaxID=150966 RepID=A0AAD3S369_NEPGR|nr:hypothetical protein Nepgr_005402 [Nepenthes gracilis]
MADWNDSWLKDSSNDQIKRPVQLSDASSGISGDMTSEPPPFQDANRCDVCKCSFTTFRRRHHCRCCGRTLCHEHSSNQLPLPHFGIHSSVRVCSDCFNDSSRIRKDDSVAPVDRVDHIKETFSRLDINEDSKSKNDPTTLQQPVLTNSECKCGMPLCICVASVISNGTASAQTAATSASLLNSKPKRTDSIPKTRRPTEDAKQTSNSGLGQSSSGLNKLQMDYELNGEGIREAIKNGDVAAVQELLHKGVDSNYCDKQGFSLLHLAAMFNQTNVVFALMEHGARLDCKNSQGETPLDCAPATLQYKMQRKMEEGLR